MPTYTNNHKLSKFAEEEEPWTHNDDMDTLDSAVPIADVEANLSEYTPYDGAKFEATDTGTVYRGDGTDWVAEGSIFDHQLDEMLDADGNDISNVGELDATLSLHKTDINENYTIPEGYGAVVAGPLTGTGEITGDGNLAVVEDSNGFNHTLTETLDAQSNDITNVGELNATTVRADNTTVSNTGMQVTITSNQRLPQDTNTTIEWDHVDFDDKNEFDATNHAFVAAEDVSVYSSFYITVRPQDNWSTGDHIVMRLLHNGDVVKGLFNHKGSTSRETFYMTQTRVDLEQGDTLSVGVRQESSGDRSIYGNTVMNNWTVMRI